MKEDFRFFPETQLWQLLITPKIGYVVWSQIEALTHQQKLFTDGASTSNVSWITVRSGADNQPFPSLCPVGQLSR
jgi:hypothetical protein